MTLSTTRRATSSRPVFQPGVARERRDLIARLETAHARRLAWLRQQILVNNRLDLLATEILGYQAQPHHLGFIQHAVAHRGKTSMILAWRGAGKTSAVTVVYILDALIRNPDVRILLVSRSSEKAQAMLSEVKKHVESNEKFIATFGLLQGSKWDEAAINVSTRRKFTKEPNVSVAGIESAVVSGHFDIIVCDDLIDDSYARTPLQREKAHNFFYATLLPCLERPDGQMLILGTRWHYKDLYGHLQERDCADSTLVVPVIEGSDVDGWVSNWPEKYGVEDMLSLRTKMGVILFGAQYECDCKRMQGKIFEYDDIVEAPDVEIPERLPRYTGVDLAVSLDSKRDLFAVVDIAYDVTTDVVYVLDFECGRHPPHKQRAIVRDHSRRHKSVKVGIEANAYQAAAADDIRRESPDVNVVKLFTSADKTTRAWALTGRFASRKIVFRQGLAQLVEQVVLFPDGDHDDGFDALDFAIKTVRAKEKRSREDFGLL